LHWLEVNDIRLHFSHYTHSAVQHGHLDIRINKQQILELEVGSVDWAFRRTRHVAGINNVGILGFIGAAWQAGSANYDCGVLGGL
jgi:hypothetical protein